MATAVKVLRRMNYLSQESFSKQYTFTCYRASQSRVSTRRSPFTTRVKRIVISVYLNSVCYLISYTRSFTKLNLFKNLLYEQRKFPDLQYVWILRATDPEGWGHIYQTNHNCLCYKYSKTSIIGISIIRTLRYPNAILNYKIPKDDLIFCKNK